MAKAVGVGKTTWCRVERGTAPPFTPKITDKIGELLELSSLELAVLNQKRVKEGPHETPKPSWMSRPKKATTGHTVVIQGDGATIARSIESMLTDVRQMASVRVVITPR
jgi:hypothetical protein